MTFIGHWRNNLEGNHRKKRCHSQRKQNEFSITIVQNTFLLHRFPPNAYPARNICVRKTRRRFIIQPCPIFCMTKHCLCTALHIAMHHYNYYTLFFMSSYIKKHETHNWFLMFFLLSFTFFLLHIYKSHGYTSKIHSQLDWVVFVSHCFALKKMSNNNINFYDCSCKDN